MHVISRADAKTQGLKRYFTGDPCKCGHVAERRVSDHGCVECSRLKARSPQERERRREYMREHQRRYRRQHPDRIKATQDKRDKRRAAALRRAARVKNPELDRAALRRSFQKHKVKRIAAMRIWRSKNKDRHSHYMRSAKAKRRGAEGHFTKSHIDRLFVKQHGLCIGCSVDLSTRYHIDHIGNVIAFRLLD